MEVCGDSLFRGGDGMTPRRGEGRASRLGDPHGGQALAVQGIATARIDQRTKAAALGTLGMFLGHTRAEEESGARGGWRSCS